MILYTPINANSAPPIVGDALGVSGAPKPSASMPLYTTTAIGDSYTSMLQSALTNTVTHTAPDGFLLFSPQTGKYYQEVSTPLSTSKPNSPSSLVATIQQPTYTTTTTATPFKTVAYTTSQPSPVPTKATQTTLPIPKLIQPKPIEPTVVAPAISTVQVSDEVKEAVAVIKQLMEQPAIRKMVTSYQQQGAAGLFNWATVRRGLSLISDSQVRQSVGELSRLLKSPDVQAAIRNPKAVLGNDDELNELLDTFHGLGLIKSDENDDSPSPIRVKKKPVIEAEAASDVDEEIQPAEALSDSDADAPGPSNPKAKAISLDELLQELEAKDPHAGHTHAKRSLKRHSHGKPSSTAAEE